MLSFKITPFQSTYLYKVRLGESGYGYVKVSFNPRTYIRYDNPFSQTSDSFLCFNPRTYIRYDRRFSPDMFSSLGFNPRTYIRYDRMKADRLRLMLSFNPRTYIRYDPCLNSLTQFKVVSIHVPI